MTPTSEVRDGALQGRRGQGSLERLTDKALHERAQEITRHGKRTVVVVTANEWDRQARRKEEGLVEFLDKSPSEAQGSKSSGCGISPGMPKL
jgi:prevent-host-death family protein